MGQQEPTQPASGTNASRKGRKRGPVRHTLRWCVITFLILAVVALIGHTIIIRVAAERVLASQIGCDVRIGTARFGSGASVVLRRVRLRAPGVPGEGGVILEAASVKASIDWPLLIAGGQGVRSVRLEDPIIRLSQDAETGGLNLLRVGGSGAASATRAVTPLPEVEFVAGLVEFGEHDPGSYTVLASIPVEGLVRVPSIAIPEYEIDLIETVDGEDRPPMRLTGDFNVETLSGQLRLVDLDLDRWQGWQAPVAARALWKEMDIRGRVSEASFTADPDSNVNAWFTLDKVRLTAPIRAPGMDAEQIRASDVDGVIRFTPSGLSAELVGTVEDLPVAMEFKTDGLNVNAPLTCTITTEDFLVSKQPDLLSFIPSGARQLFDEFGGPTGVVSGYVTLSRGVPLGAGAAPITARGELRIEDGVGKHEVFPYPVEHITGAIRFDEHEIELIGVQGISDSGATLVASGTIAPPTEGYYVDIDMVLEDIPTDEMLDRAMPPEALRVLRTLVHEPAHEELRGKGLLLSSEDHEALTARRDTLERELAQHQPGGQGSAVRRIELQREVGAINERLQTPVFDLGGLAEAHVLIDKAGPGEPIRTTIDIHFDRAGLLPEPFPYPFIATDFNIVVFDDGATATAERLDGLTGARADLIAAITFSDEATGDPGATFIDIQVEQGPVDALLLAATPSPDGATLDTLYDAVTGLTVGGVLHGSILIDSADEDGFRAELELSDVRLALENVEGIDDEPIEVTGLSGPMVVTDSRVVVGPIEGAFQTSPVTVTGLWREPAEGAEPEPIQARVELVDFDLTSKIDPVIALLGEGSAASWAELRDSRGIAGVLDLTTTIELPPGEPAQVRTALREIRDLSFGAFGSTIEIPRLRGELSVDADRIRISEVAGAMRIDDRLSGLLAASGDIMLDGSGGLRLDAELTETEFDTALLQHLSSAEGAPPTIQSWLALRQPRGVCDFVIAANREAGGELGWTMEMAPREIELTAGDDTLRLLGSGDSAIIGPGGGEIDRLLLVNSELAIDCSGLWRHGDRAAIDLDFTIDAQRLSPGMSALLPGDVNELMDALEIGIEDEWRLTRGELRWRTDLQQFTGEAEFRGLRCSPGVDITDAEGDAVMRIERSEERAEPEIEFEVTTREMRLAGVRMTGGEMGLYTAELPGRLIIDRLSANAHGGKVNGHVTIDTTNQPDRQDDPSAGGGVWYEALFDFAGVEVESLLNETASRAGGDRSSGSAPIDGFTGKFDGRLSMAGAVGDDRLRRGRGVFRIEGGELLMAPLMVPIIELSNLQAPSGESLERADAELYIDGSVVEIQEIRLRSDSISIVGQGQVTWPGMGLRLAFNSRSNNRVPILSDIVEGLRNELITTVVTGTLLAPVFRTESLPGTRQALDDLFGDDDEGGAAPESAPIQRSAEPDGVSSTSPTRSPGTR